MCCGIWVFTKSIKEGCSGLNNGQSHRFIWIVTRWYRKSIAICFSILVPYLQRLSYPQRLSRLQILSLKFRRRCSDLVNVFCIIKGVDDVDLNLAIITLFVSMIINYIPQNHWKIGQLSFVSRVAGPWNGLPLEVVEAESVQIFKSALVNTTFYLDAFVV